MVSSTRKGLFPLPLPPDNLNKADNPGPRSRSVQRRLRKGAAWRHWLREGVMCLNELSGEGSRSSSVSSASKVQRKSLEHLSRIYSGLSGPPCDIFPAGAFRELCSSSLPYLAEEGGGGPIPYQEGSVALPQASKPFCISEAVRPATFSQVLARADQLLCSETEAFSALEDAGVQRPYVDPSFRSPKVYSRFLRELHHKNLIEWTVGGKSYLGIFFVAKKDGTLRMILDTRVSNCFFKTPPKTRLPTASAMSSLECKGDEEVYFSGGDISNAFYRITVPESARPFLTLPPIRARHLGLNRLHGKTISPETPVIPRMLVLPMGWSWSLYFCQDIHEHQGELVDQSAHDHLSDRSAGIVLSSHNCAFAKYVDNYLVAGHDLNSVQLNSNRLCNQLCNKHLDVHETFGPSTKASFVGLDFDGILHTVRVGHR